MKYHLQINDGPSQLLAAESILDIVKLYKHEIELAKSVHIHLVKSEVEQ